MLRGDLVGGGRGGGAGDWRSDATASTRPSHEEIDRQLRRLAKQRAGLDAEEARWLRRADEQNAWRALGYVHALEYLEEVFGYAPRTAQEKLRVAKELAQLPALEAALEAGHMPYSIVRELTRVATPETEAAWIGQARGRNYRQVEQMLSGHKKGDKPTDASDPTLIQHGVTWKLDAATRALLRETRRALENELGHAIDDGTFVEMLCRRATDDIATAHHDRAADWDGASSGDGASSEPQPVRPTRASRPGVMIHLTTCRACKSTVQHGAGVPFALTKEQVERAECDAMIVDDEQGKRATSRIPPAMRRYVLERDQYRCRFPGCRSTRNLDIHHLEHQAHGGDHRSGNLGALCGGHHHLSHKGIISIHGDADSVLVFTRNGVEVRGEDVRELSGSAQSTLPYSAASALPMTNPRSSATANTASTANTATSSADVVSARASRHRHVERNTLAKRALQQAGYKSAVAARAVDRATASLPTDAPLELLVKEALRVTAINATGTSARTARAAT